MLIIFVIAYFIIKNLIRIAIIIAVLKKERYFQGRNISYFNGETFLPLHKNNLGKVSKKKLFKFLFARKKIWPKVEIEPISVPKNIVDNDIHISYINHCTFLLQTKKFNIITDPVFSDIAGLYNLIGVKRCHKPPIEICDLPKIDYILLSHNHYDHMDITSIKKICKNNRCTIVTPAGNDYILHKYNRSLQIYSLLWNDALHVKKHNLKIILDKSYHWSKRNLFDNNKALWGSFIIQINNKKIFFSGDTAWAHEGAIFKDIYSRYGAMDLSFLPIGSYEPRDILKYAHVNPEESVLIHNLLHSKQSLSMHHGTFCLSKESYDQPYIDLEEAKIKYNLEKEAFLGIKPGYQTIYKC